MRPTPADKQKAGLYDSRTDMRRADSGSLVFVFTLCE